MRRAASTIALKADSSYTGSCIRRDRAEKDGTKKNRAQSFIAQQKPLCFMAFNIFLADILVTAALIFVSLIEDNWIYLVFSVSLNCGQITS